MSKGCKVVLRMVNILHIYKYYFIYRIEKKKHSTTLALVHIVDEALTASNNNLLDLRLLKCWNGDIHCSTYRHRDGTDSIRRCIPFIKQICSSVLSSPYRTCTQMTLNCSCDWILIGMKSVGLWRCAIKIGKCWEIFLHGHGMRHQIDSVLNANSVNMIEDQKINVPVNLSNLGLIIDGILKFEPHVDPILPPVYASLKQLYKLRPLLNTSVRFKLSEV